MAFTKYQKVEDTKVVSPEGHRQIQKGLHDLGKTSARELTDEERRALDKPE